jgi:uncharacterized protein YcaQ
METISTRAARRLALVRAGLLKPEWTGMPRRACGRDRRARSAAHAVIGRFGYLQLDTVSIAGARSHAIVPLSRIEGFDPTLAEELLQPDEPLFEYWGHEACWLPMDLYPVFAFRREEFHHHPWWGDLIGRHPEVADRLLRQIRDEGPLRSLDMEGRGSSGWWDLKVAKKVATALWSSGELAIRERRNFQRTYDLAERVIPDELRAHHVPKQEALEILFDRALAGHGWAATGTLAQTWRLRNRPGEIRDALVRLRKRGGIVPCALILEDGKKCPGWIRPEDLELAARLEGIRPRGDRGVLLSPFDPILWDRRRVDQLFSFHQVLEIFKPASQRIYGYYCLPVLAGEKLVARLDLKADRRNGKLLILARHFEREPSSSDREAVRTALDRYAAAVGLVVE